MNANENRELITALNHKIESLKNEVKLLVDEYEKTKKKIEQMFDYVGETLDKFEERKKHQDIFNQICFEHMNKETLKKRWWKFW